MTSQGERYYIGRQRAVRLVLQLSSHLTGCTHLRSGRRRHAAAPLAVPHTALRWRQAVKERQRHRTSPDGWARGPAVNDTFKTMLAW